MYLSLTTCDIFYLTSQGEADRVFFKAINSVTKPSFTTQQYEFLLLIFNYFFSMLPCTTLLFLTVVYMTSLWISAENWSGFERKKNPSNTRVNAYLARCLSWCGYRSLGKKYVDDCVAEMPISFSTGVRMNSGKNKTSSDTRMNHIMKPQSKVP